MFFDTPESFRRWLIKYSSTSSELIVGFWKSGSSHPTMSWSESVDEALCFGWIDGVRRRLDDESYTIRFTPRKASSNWSKLNVAKYKKLLAAGRVKEAGKDAYKLRKESKSKVYSYEQEEAPLLSRAEMTRFKKSKSAWQYFEDCPPSYRKKLLHWITSAKKPETRETRFQKFMEACLKQERLT